MAMFRLSPLEQSPDKTYIPCSAYRTIMLCMHSDPSALTGDVPWLAAPWRPTALPNTAGGTPHGME